jgi:filamentous hemagglutinin family protein
MTQRAMSRIILPDSCLGILGTLGLLLAASADAQSVAPGPPLPTGGTVVSGRVTTTKSGNTLTLDQTSQTAILNWQTFSIGSGHTVKVIQPTSSSALLDRVSGNTPSVIAGDLDANGQVFLINPNGIAITPSGVIDVGGGFVASSLGISDQDFKTGKLSFSGNGASAGVSNQGVITVGRGGYAALLGGTVNNSGLISVPLGKVGLGSGEAATLDVSGDGFLQVAVPTTISGQDALIQSSGTIQAQGGTVVMSAATARAAARNAINLSGIVQANSISGHEGAITLSGGPGGAVSVSGTLDVSATAVDGGTIAVTGQHLVLQGATLSASGANGGTIEIGGDEHGSGPLLQADTLSVDANTRITANGLGTETGAGNGGNVVLWSTGQTDFLGMISATGGPEGGSGGNAEVSSENLLNYAGTTNLSAPHGAFGNLLLDPYNITISSGNTTNGSLSSGSNETFTPSGSNSILNVTTLQNALGSANVTLATGGANSPGGDTGDITVANALTWASGSTLTLSAYHSIVFEANVAITGAGGLALTTNNGGSGGSLSFWPGASVQFQGTNVDGTAQGSLTVQGNSYSLVNSMTGLSNMNTGSGSYTALAIPLTSTTTYTGPVVSSFAGNFEGLGNTVSNLTINGTTSYIGLFGSNSGTIRDLGLIGGSVGNANGATGAQVGDLVGTNTGTLTHVFATGTINAFASDNAGGLVGANSGSITSSYATGSVNDGGTGTGQYGGLVGYNETGGSIDQSFATGSVTNTANSSGGLVGLNGINASISNSYATGAAFTNNNGGFAAGGLVGDNIGSITNSYAIGVATFSGATGGLVGDNNNGSYNGTISNSTWDTTSSGTNTGIGYNPTNVSISGTSTTNMQTSAEATALGSDFAGGSGIYPYLKSIFPNGIQALTGTVYSDAGVTRLPSGSNGNVPVTITVNGVMLGSATANSLGGYYFAVPAGTVTASNALLVYSTAPTSSQSGADLGYAAGFTGLDIYGGGFYDNTYATTYSTAGVATVLGYSTTPSFIASLPLQINARGASFTLDQTLSPTTNLTVVTNSGDPITVASPLTVTGSNTLWLYSQGALDIDALVNATGAGTVKLNYNTASATNLSFGTGGSVRFTGGSAGSPQGALNINGTAYTLVNSMASLDAIDGTLATTGGSVTTYGAGLAGNYALAVPLSASGTTYAEALIGIGGNSSYKFTGTFEGLGNTISGLTISESTSTSNDPALFGYLGQGGTVRDVGVVGGNISSSGSGSNNIGGLVGRSDGTVVSSYSSATVNMGATSGTDLAGGLVGDNFGSIVASYATGTVSGGNSANIGGLVGRNEYASGGYPGSITQSYATGPVSGGTNSGIGGLSGIVYNGATVTSSYASGPVTGGSSSDVGGLVGQLYSGSTITQSYSTGAVSGAATVGGLLGSNAGTLTNSVWDTSTSGTTTGIGTGSNSGATGYTTAQLQSTSTSGVSLGSAFSGGAAGTTSGVYPYLTTFYPTGVQAVSGIAYRDIGVTPLASSASGNGIVSVTLNGTLEGTPYTGANGYYYLTLPANSIASSGSNVLAYTQSGTGYNAVNGAALTSATGTTSGLNVYGGYLSYLTPLTTYSAASAGLSTLETTVTGYSSTPSFVTGLAPYFLASGASFTVDQSPGTLTTNFGVQTTANNSSLVVDVPLTLSGSNTLTLTSAGTLAIDANVVVSGAGTVNLNYDTTTALGNNMLAAQNFGFGPGDSLQFTGGTSGSPLGSLNISGNSYTLINSMTQLASTSLTGYSALATPLTAPGTAYSAALIGTGSSGTSSTYFTGTFEGLGNTVTGLLMTSTASNTNVGLFGYIGSSGIVRDIGLLGGNVKDTATNGSGVNIGELAGTDAGVILQSYTTGAVGLSGTGGSTFLGGLVGNVNAGSVTASYATGTITGSSSQNDGGLVGRISGAGTVSQSFATGAVTSGGNGGTGGLVGRIDGSSAVVQYSYATGAVTATNTGGAGNVGGLVGQNNGAIDNSYATGAVTNASGSSVGGVVPSGTGGGTQSNTYWDKQTTGITATGPTGTTGETTAQLQGSTALTLGGAFTGGAAGGTSGIYPYLTTIYPNGIQTVSGIAYKSAGSGSPLTSGTAGAGLVSLSSGGALEGTITTGANGYYYFFVPAGAFSANQGLVAFTQASGSTGAANAVTFTQSTGGTTLSNVNVYGGWELDQPGSGITTLSGLNSALSTAEGATSASALSLANREIDAAGSFSIDQSLSVSGALALSSTGSVGETNSAALTAASLLLTGAGGSYTLNDSNQISTLAGSSGSISLTNSGNLATGSLTGAAGSAVVGLTTTGTLSVVNTGNLTLASGDTVSGSSPVLAATGAFINNAGSAAVTATSGRWLIYSSAPGNDTFGSLNSANSAVFDATYASLAPGSVTQIGNRYLFANQPALTVTSNSDGKLYGVDDSSSILGDYTITGLPSVAGVFTADSLANVVSGTPTVTSAGSGAYAPVSGSPYTMSVALGSLASSAGYTFNFVNSGQLSITPATITVAGATGVNKTYDTTTALNNGAIGYTLSGIYSNDLSNVTVSATTDAYVSPNAGPENITVSGLSLSGSAAGNYQLSSTTATGSGSIGKATITVAGATGVNKTYDTTTALVNGATGYALSGIYSSDLSNVTVSATTDAYVSPNAGPENITVSGLSLSGSASGNYQLSSATATGSGTIGPATITVTGATGVNKIYDTTTALANGAVGYTLSGIYSTDLNNVGVSATTDVYASPNAGPENINVAGLSLSGSASGNYQLSSTTATGSGTISPATITVAGSSGVNKVYDTTTALPSGATGYTLSGIYPTDAGILTVSAANAAYASPNAGLENINVSGLSLTGSAAGNYQLSSTTATGSGTISPATITVAGASGVNKPYDGTTALPAGATGFTFSGVYASDATRVSIAAGNAAYASANVGPENVNVSGLTLSGTAAGNYVLNASNVTGSGTIISSNNGNSGSGSGSGSTSGNTSTGSTTNGGSNGSGTTGGGSTTSGGSTTGGGSTTSGGSTTGGSGTTSSGGTGGTASSNVALSSLSASGGSSGFALSGTSTSASANGQAATVVGSLSNGVVTITGTFIITPRSASGAASLPDEIAANANEIVTFVPGTVTVQLPHSTANALASTTAAAAFNEGGEPFNVVPLVFPSLDDPTRPWDAINTFGNPGFDQALVCLAGQCALIPRGANRRFTPALVVR